MGRIASAFRRLGKINEAALVPHLTVGYPSLDITRQLVPIMARQGADIIGIGIPTHGAPGYDISHNISGDIMIEQCLSLATEARRANEIPLLFVISRASIVQYGPYRFAVDCAASGVDGFVVPDLLTTDAAEFKEASESSGIDLILRITPANADSWFEVVAELASGFVYCVSDPGAAEEIESTAELVARVRLHTDLPLVVDSGISTQAEVAIAAMFAEGVAISTAITELIQSVPEEDVMLDVAGLVRELKEATAKQAN